MPPALSDDEMSDASGMDAAATSPPPRRKQNAGSYAHLDSDDSNDASETSQNKKRSELVTTKAKTDKKSNGTKAEARQNGFNQNTDTDEDDGSSEEEAQEYEVQRIIGHVVQGNRNVRFHVMWKGYPDPADYTWEPEKNLAGNATEILDAYIAKIGGRESLFTKPGKGKKRGRQSSGAATPAVPKRARKSEEHPADRETPRGAEPFRPPAGSWEDDVIDVEMYRNSGGELYVCLTWKGGQKSQHPVQQTYLRCPQKILRFYESHISFKTDAE